jgi:hypothetical protein
MGNKPNNTLFRILFAVVLSLMALGAVGSAYAQSEEPPAPPEGFPYELKLVNAAIEEGEDEARQQWALEGFDPAEFGGNDSDCTNTELDAIRWIDEISAPDEDCLTIFEWSLKDGDSTIASGMYALEPEEEDQDQAAEWIRFSFEQSTGQVRFVGTLWRLPKGWNGHQLAVDLTADWQQKNLEEWNVVGLSPTDDYIMGLWAAAEAESDGGEVAPAATAEPTDAEEVFNVANCDEVDEDDNALNYSVSIDKNECTYDVPAAEEVFNVANCDEVDEDDNALNYSVSIDKNECTYDVPSTNPGNPGGDGVAVPNFFQKLWNLIVGSGTLILVLAIMALIWWVIVLIRAFRRSWIVGLGILALGFLLTPLVAAIIGEILLWRAKTTFWTWRPGGGSTASTTTTTS